MVESVLSHHLDRHFRGIEAPDVTVGWWVNSVKLSAGPKQTVAFHRSPELGEICTSISVTISTPPERTAQTIPHHPGRK
jgi:hypothetical protein